MCWLAKFPCRSSLSTAAWVGCLATVCGLCFLTRSCDCLWHKHHYCDHCGQKVSISHCGQFGNFWCLSELELHRFLLACFLGWCGWLKGIWYTFNLKMVMRCMQVADFTKDDPCMFADPVHWTEISYAVPAWDRSSLIQTKHYFSSSRFYYCLLAAYRILDTKEEEPIMDGMTEPMVVVIVLISVSIMYFSSRITISDVHIYRWCIISC